MSVNVSRTYSFGYGKDYLLPNQLDSEFDNIVGAINAANAGNLTWDNIKVTTATITTATLTNPLAIASGGTASSTTLNNNRVMVSSASKISEAAAITAARVLISDANGIPVAATTTTTTLGYLDATSSVQTQINGKQATLTAGQLAGTATNDNASAGNVGEFISSVVSTSSNFASSGTWDDLTSVSLTAGDWDISATLQGTINTSTWTEVILGVSVTAGNSETGLVSGDNRIRETWASSATTPATKTLCIPPWRLSLSTTTTVYLKQQASYSLGVPKRIGRISARRMR